MDLKRLCAVDRGNLLVFTGKDNVQGIFAASIEFVNLILDADHTELKLTAFDHGHSLEPSGFIVTNSLRRPGISQ